MMACQACTPPFRIQLLGTGGPVQVTPSQVRRRRLRQIAPAQPCADPNQDLPITDKLTDKFPVGEIRIVQTGAVDRGLNPGARNDMRLVRPVQAHRLLENPPWGAGARSRQYQTAAGSQYSTP